MFTCEVCNRTFKANSSYIQHLNIEIKKGDLLHKDLLIQYYDYRVKEKYKHIDVLNVSYKATRPYLQIFNFKCGHASLIRADHILSSSRECSHQECTSKNKSISLLGKSKSEIHKQHIREAQNDPEFKKQMSIKVKSILNTPEIKKKHKQGIYNARNKHAEGIASWQRRKKSTDESYVIQLLNTHNISYQWQKVLITDKHEFIIDFFLPEFNTYIMVNTDPFHKLSESNSIKYIERCKNTIKQDEALKEIFKKNKDLGYLFMGYSLKDIQLFISNIRKENY